MADTSETVRRFLAGHRAAAHAQRILVQRRGPQPEQAVAECFGVLELMERLGTWPGPRDPVSEEDVERVRDLWARVKREYRSGG